MVIVHRERDHHGHRDTPKLRSHEAIYLFHCITVTAVQASLINGLLCFTIIVIVSLAVQQTATVQEHVLLVMLLLINRETHRLI
jgi:hypothetical protein